MYDGDERSYTDGDTFNGFLVRKQDSKWYGHIEISKLKLPFTLSSYITITTNNYNNTNVRIRFSDENKSLLSTMITGSSATSSNKRSKVTLTENDIPANAKYVVLFVRIQDSGYTEKTQIEYSSTATPYTPDKEQVLPLTLGNIELCKIGDYQDYFYKESNKWYLHKEIEKVVLDGVTNSLTYHLLANKLHCGYINLSHAIVKPTNNDIKIDTLSNRFLAYSINIMLEKSLIGVGIRSDGLVFFSFGENSSLTSTELINQFLQNNNNEFYYPLATPTNTEITDTTLISQLEAINNALSYEEQTNIRGSSNGSNPIFNVEAYQSTKLILQNIDSRLTLVEG